MLGVEDLPKSFGQDVCSVVHTWDMDQDKLLVLIDSHHEPVVVMAHVLHTAIHNSIFSKLDGRLIVYEERDDALGIAYFPDLPEPSCLASCKVSCNPFCLSRGGGHNT